MSDCMTFPNTVEEFMEQYKVVDTDCVYSNGIEFVPIFRMKQWFEHLVGNTINRQNTITAIRDYMVNPKVAISEHPDDILKYNSGLLSAIQAVNDMPSVQPEIIKCKYCKHRGEKPIADGRYWCELHDTFMYYCSDAERRTDDERRSD